MNSEFDELTMELREIQKARSLAQTEAMREYDKSVYRPALQSLQVRCSELGHQFSTSYHVNPFGYSWRSCLVCGERTDVTAPPEQQELDDVKLVGEYPSKLPNVPPLRGRTKLGSQLDAASSEDDLTVILPKEKRTTISIGPL